MKKVIDRIKLIPVIFAMGYIPLIVSLHIYDSGFESFDWFPAFEDGIMYDFFLYFKSVAIIVCAVVMLLILIVDIVGKKITLRSLVKDRSFIFIFMYLFFVIISGAMSEYPKESFFGAPEVFEGVFVIAGYVVFCIYSYLYVRDAKGLRMIFKWTFPGILLLLFIGLSQIISRDLLAADFVRTLIVPSFEAGLRSSLIFEFAPGVAYGTLYNSNYVAGYAGFVFFISLAVIICKNLKMHYRVPAVLSAVLSFLMIIKADSRSGLLSFFTALMFFIIFGLFFAAGKKVGRKGTLVVFCCVAAVLLLLVFLAASRFGIFAADPEDERIIENVKTDKDSVSITVNGRSLKLSYELTGDDFFLNMTDETGKEPKYVLSGDGMRFCLSDPVYAGMEIFPGMMEERLCMVVKVDGKELVFSDFGKDRGYLYYNKAGKFAEFHKYEKSGVFADTLFTDRGLIWNYCIKMLPRYILKGCGANAFVYAYPNDDDYYRLYHDKDTAYFDVKAHSLYFQQTVENGIPALIFFILFYVLYFCKTLIHYAANGIRRDELCDLVCFAILAGSICYMIAGLANDSNVNTAPVFWVLLGTGLIPYRADD